MSEHPPPNAARLHPEPFVSFPLWGLRQALSDHIAACAFCSTNRADQCRDAWYTQMLTDKIENAVSRLPRAKTKARRR